MFGLFFENCLLFRFWFLHPLLIFYQAICFGRKFLFCQTCTLSVSWGRRGLGLSRNTLHQTTYCTSVVSQSSTFFSQIIETDIVNFWELAMPVLPKIILIMLSSADSKDSCQDRVGITLTKLTILAKRSMFGKQTKQTLYRPNVWFWPINWFLKYQTFDFDVLAFFLYRSAPNPSIWYTQE